MSMIKKYSGGSWQESYYRKYHAGLTSVGLPVYLAASGNTLDNSDIEIAGNTVQDRTPTPANPIIPDFCGKKVSTDWTIPITCAGQTVPIYLGQVPTVRRIKKLALTGTDSWQKSSIYSDGFFLKNAVTDYVSQYTPAYCSHFVQSVAQQDYTSGKFILTGDLNIRCGEDQWTLTDWKTWLSDQYTAGTPVTVWYVLATPETAIVNEPLAKIGDYADELHISDAGVTIPVPAGDTKLDIDTYLPPSSVKISNFWSTHSDVKVYQNNAWQISSWDGFRDLVRAGTAETAYPVGTILYTTWGDTTSEAVQILAYDVADYMNPMLTEMGYTHNVVLCDLKANTRRVFDTPEAWLYVETELPAGVYRFTIPNYDATYGGNKTYIFTSTATVPVGGQITLNWAYQQNPASVAGYSAPASGTALFTASISVWDGTTASTDLGTIKLTMTDPESTYGKLNNIQRARYGSNNYYQSGIRQWLNSDKAANNWWEPTTIFDRAYANRNTNGKLYSLSKDFVRSLAKSTVKCVTNQIFEFGSIGNTLFSIPDKPYIVRDRVFMLTHTEVNLSAAPNVGSVLTFYSGAGNSARIKYNNNGGAEHWWLRTPNPALAYNELLVHSSGALSFSGANSTLIVGVAAYTIQ